MSFYFVVGCLVRLAACACCWLLVSVDKSRVESSRV
jgi:hypothetical protein